MKLKLFVNIFLILIIQSCDGQKNQAEQTKVNKQEIKEMNNAENLNFAKQISDLKKSMIEFMEMSNPTYSKKDVDECEKILNDYVSEIHISKSKEDGMKIAKNAVEKLNKLNEKTNFSLIETSEREQIAEIIILASSKKGYNKPEEDITENWREW